MANRYAVSSPPFTSAAGVPLTGLPWVVYPETDQGKPTLIRTADRMELVIVEPVSGTLGADGRLAITDGLYASDDIDTRYILEIASVRVPFTVLRGPTDLSETLELPHPSSWVPPYAGPRAPYNIEVYIAHAGRPADDASGGFYTVATDTLVAPLIPVGTSITLPVAAAGEDVWKATSRVSPDAVGTYVPTWSAWGDYGEAGPPGVTGDKGWSAIAANVVDGDRIVEQIVGWAGGTGAAPPSGQFLGPAGFVDHVGSGTDKRGVRGDQGIPGRIGDQGPRGAEGFAGPGDIAIWLVLPTADGTPADPADGTYNIHDGAAVLPGVWSAEPTSPDADETLWKSIAHLNPHNADAQGIVVLSFSHAFLVSETVVISRTGPQGEKGWAAVYGRVVDGERVVEQLVAWVGGTGAAPGQIGMYAAAGGLVADIADATDVRGARGPRGDPGQTGTGGGLTAAAIDALDEGEAHTTAQLPGIDAGGLLSKFSLSEIINLVKSSAGLARQLLPSAAVARAGQLAVVNATGTGWAFRRFGLVHRDIIGAPTGAVHADEYLDTNRDGDVFPVRRVDTHTTVDALGSSDAFVDVKYQRDPESLATLWNSVGAWGFFFPGVDTSAGLATQSGAALGQVSTGVSWVDTWQAVIDGTNPDAARLAVLDGYRLATYLGAHRNDAAAAAHMTRLGVDAAGFAAGAFYYTKFGTLSFGLRHLTAYTEGSSTDVSTLAFGGRLATHAEVVAHLPAYQATMGDLADITGDQSALDLVPTFANITQGLVAGADINAGGWTVETDGTRRDKLVAAVAGRFLVTGHTSGAVGSGNGNFRAWTQARLMRERGGVTAMVGTTGTVGYARNVFSSFAVILESTATAIVDIEVGDKVWLEMHFDTQDPANYLMSLDGANCSLACSSTATRKQALTCGHPNQRSPTCPTPPSWP